MVYRVLVTAIYLFFISFNYFCWLMLEWFAIFRKLSSQQKLGVSDGRWYSLG